MLLEPVVPKLNAGYAYASGVVRSLEKKMLKKSDYQKMAEAGVEELKQLFLDAGYQLSEESLDQKLKELQTFVDRNSKDKPFTDMFKYHWEYKRAALFLRKTLQDQPVREVPGVFPYEEFSKQVAVGRSALPPAFAEAIEKAARDYEVHFLPHRIDSVMEREYLTTFFGAIPAENNYLRNYFSVIADQVNLTTAIRYSERNLLSDDFKEFYIPFGFIPFDILDEIWETDRTAIGSRMNATVYGKELADALSHALAEKDLSVLDSFFIGSELELLGQSIYYAFGLEVLVAYFEKKSIEISTLRKIFRAKVSGLPEEETKGVISYVLV